MLLVSGFAVAESDRNYPFQVQAENMSTHHRILAKNGGPAPVTARISISISDGAATDRAWPATISVPPHGALVVGNVFARNKGQSYSFRTKATWLLGALNAKQDHAAAYRLPFADGLKYIVSQAPGGPITTHTSPESAQAIDITMPEGTLVLAARAGTVISVESGYTHSGKEADLLDKANKVVVLHEDGTMANYAHLGPGRQLVQVGQIVREGAPIAYSGNTGFSSGPHLHFAITRVIELPSGELGVESLPILFYAHNPPVRFAPQANTWVWANYTQPVHAVAELAAAPAATGKQEHRSQGITDNATGYLEFIKAKKRELDDWVGSEWGGWLVLGAPVAILLFLGAGGGATSSGGQERREPF